MMRTARRRSTLGTGAILSGFAALALAALIGPGVAWAADPSPTPGPQPESTASASPTAWPTGDELRRGLQLIGFSFRVDRVAREWRGWAPTFALDRPPSVRLGVDGRGPAWAAFEIDLLAVEARAVDVESTLTAFLEVLARVPLPGAEATRLFTFVGTDLLTLSPEQLEACAVARLPSGLAVIRVDQATGLASLLIAQAADARDAEADLDGCVPLRPRTLGPAPGSLITERLTVVATDPDTLEPDAGPALETGFDPAEPTVEGSLVTVVLLFRNDASVEHTLTFDGAVSADSGPVGPGEERLLVLRRLEPGDYPFFSATEPDAMRGVLRIVPPPDPAEADSPGGAEETAAP
jgi:hypothetical protein